MSDSTDMGRLLAEAEAAWGTDLQALTGLDDEDRAAFNELTAAPSSEDEIDPHADAGPHLTDEEWQYVLDVEGTDG